MGKAKIKLTVLVALASVSLYSMASVAYAASLYFSPSSSSYTVGSTIPLNVYVASIDQAMNAASGVISFPPDKLEVASISKGGSIITLWVHEPSFSNRTGKINFEGIVLSPGFIGDDGKAITINFKVKAAGNAVLDFSSGSVLANDGQGTNILTRLGTANLSLGGAASQAPESTTPAELIGTPTAPKISSPTHPDTNKWYALNDAKFTWPLPADVVASRLLAGGAPQSVPTITYIPAINSKEVSDLADGVWYFHVRLKNKAGWGGISHFRFQIDTEKPSSFDIQEISRKDKTDPRARFKFNAKDKTSGIDHYEVQIDEGGQQPWKDDGSGVYERSEEHTSELQSHSFISYAVFCLKKKKTTK